MIYCYCEICGKFLYRRNCDKQETKYSLCDQCFDPIREKVFVLFFKKNNPDDVVPVTTNEFDGLGIA